MWRNRVSLEVPSAGTMSLFEPVTSIDDLITLPRPPEIIGPATVMSFAQAALLNQ